MCYFKEGFLPFQASNSCLTNLIKNIWHLGMLHIFRSKPGMLTGRFFCFSSSVCKAENVMIRRPQHMVPLHLGAAPPPGSTSAGSLRWLVGRSQLPPHSAKPCFIADTQLFSECEPLHVRGVWGHPDWSQTLNIVKPPCRSSSGEIPMANVVSHHCRSYSPKKTESKLMSLFGWSWGQLLRKHCSGE